MDLAAAMCLVALLRAVQDLVAYTMLQVAQAEPEHEAGLLRAEMVKG